ncbi:hypothetical protein Ddye_004956 [Dipteronia dyeriana]|uniref:DDE Tnp4 domain-containing protein n=1 Tax=Dipteronia dyeriana TaxID=168575 RepID=A0AAE0CPS8_9ROSI|nr:hypothetical protein Ddye_004956 [Dipteronia dyeriana]
MDQEFVEQAIRDDMEFDELVLAIARTVVYYHNNFLAKEPCRNSPYLVSMFIMEILKRNYRHCHEQFRMEIHVFIKLCDRLRSYGLTSTKGVGLKEGVGMFLMTLRHGVGNIIIQEQFQHSGETDCIRVIDGTHVRVSLLVDEQIPYIGMKGFPTQNIMVVCGFDMLFTFVCPGWEGTTHDTRIFLEAIRNTELKFPKPPDDKYYLVDSGYPNMMSYYAPYKGERYHLQEFRSSGQPKSYRETFNYVHSSLRSVIERCFGVWKAQWRILQHMSNYNFDKQVVIVTVSLALHNFMREAIADVEFESCDENQDYVLEPEDEESYINLIIDEYHMGVVRDRIARELMLS